MISLTFLKGVVTKSFYSDSKLLHKNFTSCEILSNQTYCEKYTLMVNSLKQSVSYGQHLNYVHYVKKFETLQSFDSLRAFIITFIVPFAVSHVVISVGLILQLHEKNNVMMFLQENAIQCKY